MNIFYTTIFVARIFVKSTKLCPTSHPAAITGAFQNIPLAKNNVNTSWRGN